MKEKVELRQTLRAKRQSLNEADRNRKSLAIANQLALLDSWPASKGIAVYSPADGEIDPKYITAAARACGKAVFLPIVNKEGKLDFAQWREEDRLVFNRFKILEPSCASPYENTDELSIIFLPLVGWDRSGNRLGMGGGFYDKTLASLAAEICLVGLGFSIQEVKQIPVESTDRQLDFVITESEIISKSERMNN